MRMSSIQCLVNNRAKKQLTRLCRYISAIGTDNRILGIVANTVAAWSGWMLTGSTTLLAIFIGCCLAIVLVDRELDVLS
jgi:hypothetical protein